MAGSLGGGKAELLKPLLEKRELGDENGGENLLERKVKDDLGLTDPNDLPKVFPPQPENCESEAKVVVSSESGISMGINYKEGKEEGHWEDDCVDDEVLPQKKRKLEEREEEEDLLQQGKLKVRALMPGDIPAEEGKEEENAGHDFAALPFEIPGGSRLQEEEGKKAVEVEVVDEDEVVEPWTKEDFEAWWKEKHGTEYTPEWGPRDLWECKSKGLDAPFPGVAEIVPLNKLGEGEGLPEGKFELLELPDPNIPHEAKILPLSESGVDISSSGSKFVVLSESGLGGSKVGESSLIFKGNNREQGGKGHRENDSADDEVLLHNKRKLEEYEGVEDLQQGKGKVKVGALISRDSPSDKGKEEEDAGHEFVALPLKVLGGSSSENPVSVSSSDLVCPTDVEEGGKEDVEDQVKDENGDEEEEEGGPWTKEDFEAWWKDKHGTEYTPEWSPRDVPEDETLLASWERYHKQIEDSEGYDITEFPGYSMAAPITPLFNFKECSETLPIIRELTSAAMEKFNEGIEKEEDRYEVHDILTANAKCPRNCWFYITFQAKKKGKSPNTEGAASPLATFQARVLKNFIDEEEPVVEECRIKSS